MAKIVTYRPEHLIGVDAVWKACFPDDAPWNRAQVAIPAKLAFQPELLFVAVDGEAVIGTTMAGYDGHRGWLYSVAVHPGHRRTGLGAALVGHAEQALRALGCGKINLQVRADNEAVIGFYRALGYAVEDRISLGKRC